MVSNEFILECKNGANGTHNRLGIIKTEDNLISITNSDNLSNFTIDMGCLINGTVIGSVYVKSLTGEFIGLESDVSLEDKTINAQIGVKYDDNSTEMFFMGKYTVERPNASETANNYKIQAFDSLYKNIDKQYLCGLDFENNAITLKDLYSDVCSQLELIPNSLEFINDNIPIYNNPFTNKETNRIVLQTIAKIACSFITIDYETNEIVLDWFSDSDEPDYTFERSDYATLVGGEIKYGPINSVIIKNGQIDSENVTMTDSESIEENGEHSIVISDDYILYNSQLRQMAIQNIFDRLNGFKYVDCKITSYYGKPFLKVGSKIRIITENGFIDTFVLNHKFTYDGTFYSEIDSSALTEQEISTKQNITLKEKLRNTEIIVNKQDGEIKLLTQNTNEISDNLNNNYYTKTSVNEIIQNAENGVTNTFSEAGGNNIFRNTGLWFEENNESNKYLIPSNDLYPSQNTYSGALAMYEYWSGYVKRKSNDDAVNYNSLLLQKGTLIQEQEVPNGIYAISFYYIKLKRFASVSVVINDVEYVLDSLVKKQFYTGEQDSETGEYITQPINVTSKRIRIEFKSDADDSAEVYDLMCNKGNVKLAYSQNYNETTTDTVNISKGITITSTNMETIFKANANGIKIYTLSGSLIAYFTDKGLSTKQIVVEDEAQIVKTLWQEVGDQTWITRM